jgi:hypothetical protein
MGVERDEWGALVNYWQGWETQNKVEIMASARGVVVTINTYRHASKVGVQKKLVSATFQP